MSGPADAKATMMARIREGLRVDPAGDRARKHAVAERLARPPRGTIPERGSRSGEARIALFTEMLSAQSAEVARAAVAEDIVVAIANYLVKVGAPAALRIALEPVLAALPWSFAPDIARSFGPAEAGDTAGLTRAILGVAETGTLFFVSGPDTPMALNFLPETHIVLVAASDIVAAYEDGFDRLRALYGAGTLPRSLTWISGPSRTGDIEQTIVRGAHGPKRLLAIVLG